MKCNRIRLWRSLVILVIASMIGQLVLPAFAPAPAYASAGPAATQPAPASSAGGDPALPAQVKALERLLAQLSATTGDAEFDETLARVQSAWQTIVAAENEAAAGLAAQAAEMAARGQEKGRQRTAAQQEEQSQQLAAFSGRFEALAQLAQTDRAAARLAATSLRADLQTGMARAEPPARPANPLPNRPAPKTKDARQYPSLEQLRGSGGHGPSRSGAVPFATAQSLAAPLAAGAIAAGPLAAEPPPTPGDLLSTEDAAITPEIQALADSLGRDPLAIYAYVHDKIAFEPYYGSRKGALLTLWERSGNDMDTASLLIALLRASGYYARYVQGEVAVDGVQARNWVGNAPDLATAANILASGGVPVGISADGYLIKEQWWVEVYDPTRASVDFNFNGLADVGDIQLVAAAIGSHNIYYDRNQNGVVDVADVPLTAAGWKQPVTTGWMALDASFKQFNYYEPANLAALTGFNAETYIDEAIGSSINDDSLQAMYSLPMIPSPDGDPHDQLDWADNKQVQAVTATLDFINANPTLTNVDLVGGAYIITETLAALPADLPFIPLGTVPLTDYSEIPAAKRDTVAVQVYSDYGVPLINYTASYPGLANKRVTVSYEAATQADQDIINSYGGTLLTTPPVVDLVPVLRINGTEVARGATGQRMGTFQTRRLFFTDANGYMSAVDNSIAVGSTFAVGLGYGRGSTAALEAAQQRLKEARDALPKTAAGDPDPDAPGNMAEPVIGEMLNISLIAYFSQLDVFSEMQARARHVRWFRYLSAGIAMQNLVFGYSWWGYPVETRGGGMGFDIQQNVVSVQSLTGNDEDERVFMEASGVFGSALESSLWENLGHGAVSTIELLARALARGIPVYRIDSTNRAQILPLLKLNSSTLSYITSALDQGQVVTVSEDEVTMNEWTGVGFIVADPVSGAAGYMISGGLFGNSGIVSGGSLWDVLKTVAAYAWLAINMGLDLWGVWTGLLLLFAPEPTMLTKLAGIALIVANLAALGFDIGDLRQLLTGDKSAQQYIAEQISGLIVQALLKRFGIAAARRILEEIGPDMLNPLIRQLDDITGGLISRMFGHGFLAADFATMIRRGLSSTNAFQAMDDMAVRYGPDLARTLLNNNAFDAAAIEAVAREAAQAPDVAGLLVRANGSPGTLPMAVSRADFGYAYELRRAVTHGADVVEYGRRTPVAFQQVTGVDANGFPILGNTVTRELEGDLVLSNGTWIDCKHGNFGNIVDIYNELQKGQAAIWAHQITGYQFEASGRMAQSMQTWARTNAPDVKFFTNLGDGFR